MRVAVDFQDGRLELDLPGESLVGTWSGPEGMSKDRLALACRAALEDPLEFPPCREMFVAGDRVAIALDPSVPDADEVLQSILDLCMQRDVDVQETTVVVSRDEPHGMSVRFPAALACEAHDPGDTGNLAYLATTANGRRVYLNRRLTDADVVVPVGRLGYDPTLGYRGPWSTLFPALSDSEALADHRLRLADAPHGKHPPRARLDEVFEVGWLLGTQFQVGLVPGVTGVVRVIAGRSDAVRDHGIKAVDESWNFQSPARAQCVIVGIGSSGRESSLADLANGLVTASRVVQHGGRIVALSNVRGPLGASLQRLLDAGDVKEISAALRGHEGDPDSVVGRQLARVLDWADVYLLSGLDRQTAEDLFMIPLEHVDDARRLVARSGSCTVIGRGEWTRATVAGEVEH